MKRQNQTINLFKAFACVGVVLIHYKFPEPFGQVFRSIGTFGVPFFFTVSGFFLFSRPEQEWDANLFVRKAKHILGILLWSVPLFSLLAITVYRNGEALVPWLREVFSAGKLVKFFLTNNPLVYQHTWFMYAQVYCYLLLLLCFRSRRQIVRVAYSGPFLFLCLALLQEFSDLHILKNSIPIADSKDSLYLSATIVFRAFPFLFSGVLLREHEEKIRFLRISEKGLLAIFLAGILSAIVESFFFANAQVFLGSYCAVIAAMMLSIKNPYYHHRFISYIGDKLSLYIYVLHVAVGSVLNYCASKINISSSLAFQRIRPILVILITISISHLIVVIKSEKSHTANAS